MTSKGRRRRTFNGRPVGRFSERMAKQLAGQAVIEWTLASGQVLREEFGFDTEQVGRYVDLTLKQAERNRAQAREEEGR